MRRLALFRKGADGEDGVTLIIVALCLIGLFGMLVLVVDVGGLLLNRREMVNASDAAALAAAKSCISPMSQDTTAPEFAADTLATENSSKAKAASIQNIIAPASLACKPAPTTGYLTVQYSADQHLFFAPVLGAGNTGSVTTQATVIWGPPKAVNPLPLVVYENSFNNCQLDTDPTPGPNCYIWETNKNTGGSQSGFGYLDLRTDKPSQYGWNSVPGAVCTNTGLLRDWVENYPDPDVGDLPINYPAATPVCRLDGGASSVFGNDNKKDGPVYDLIGDRVLFFPINRCDPATPATFGQLDQNGNPISCGLTPNQYDIVGFVALKLINVYTPNQAKGTTTACGNITQNFAANSPDIDLDTLSALCGSYTALSAPTLKTGPCCTEGVQYTYDAVNHVIHWTDGKENNVKITWDAIVNGPCGQAPPGGNEGHCLVVQIVDVAIGGSDPGTGEGVGSNIRAYRLCDSLVSGSCRPILP